MSFGEEAEDDEEEVQSLNKVNDGCGIIARSLAFKSYETDYSYVTQASRTPSYALPNIQSINRE